MRRLAIPLLLLAALCGCRLIDQRTFERSGVGPSAAGVTRSAELAQARAQPLVSVFPGQLDHDWQPDVLAAVRDALVRQPDAAFDIVTPFPTSRGSAAQTQAMQTGAADAAAVATVIEGDGVAADHLHLGARGDAGNPAREVMVYLRGPSPPAGG